MLRYSTIYKMICVDMETPDLNLVESIATQGGCMKGCNLGIM